MASSNKCCLSCEAKIAIIFLSPSSPFSEEDIHCADPKCMNYDSPIGSPRKSSLDELTEAQLVVLAGLHLHGTEEMEKLKKILELPVARMTEDQRCHAKEEVGKFVKLIKKYHEEKNPETATSRS